MMKRIGNGPCACACRKIESDGNGDRDSAAASSSREGASSSSATAPRRHGADDLDAFARPSMATLHEMLHERKWGGIQDAIRKDASVAMRIDDSPEEDRWFDEARRGKAALGGFDTAAFGAKIGEGGYPGGLPGSNSARGEDAPPMQLRYWVGNQATYSANPNNDFASANVDAKIRAKVDIKQKRTLLHSLCRMYYPSNEALIVQLKHGDSEGLKNLMSAVKTAQMLIDASHNRVDGSDGTDGDEKSSDESPGEAVAGARATCDGRSPRRDRCPWHFYRNYCPPVPLPPVERQPTVRPQHDQTGSQDGDCVRAEEDREMIQHTSVLTMTDAMGESPLHALTGAGSCHVDLVEVFLKACRPPGESSGGRDSDRRPTVYDLLVIQNFHGCTPVHFLADSKNEEALRALLKRCQFHNASPGAVHPTMISDNEGDLPLHFATCNGASPSLLIALTTAWGDSRSSLVRNSQGRLAVDDLIEWYMDSLDDHSMNHDVFDGDDSSETESGEESEGDETSSAFSNDSLIKEESAISTKNAINPGDPIRYVLGNFGFLSEAKNWETKLWNPMWVLIQAAATAIRNSAREGRRTAADDNAWLPLHAAVIATKHANFPALTVVAGLWRNDGDGDGIGGENRNSVGDMPGKLLKQDSYGCLPLHWACGGDIASLLSAHVASNDASTSVPDARADVPDSGRELGRYAFNNNTPPESNGVNRGPVNPSTSKCKEIVRWSTKDLPCSMIEYLLHCEPRAARIPTRHERLPLHLLAEDGNSFTRAHPLQNGETDDVGSEFVRRPWDDFVAMLKEFPDALGTPDAISRLYPFQVAAASYPSSRDPAQTCTTEPQTGLLSLDNTYRLIMEDPSLLCQIIEK